MTEIVVGIVAAACGFLAGYLVGVSRDCRECAKQRKEWYGR